MPKTAKLNPTRTAQELIRQMKKKADPKRAAGLQRYFKEPIEVYGLDNATAKGMLKETTARVKGSWTLKDAVACCKAMVKDPHLEPRGIGFQIVAAFVSEADPTLLKDVRRWLERSTGNWALVDNLAPSVLAPLVEAHPEIIPELAAWTGSKNMWLRRGAAVAFVPLACRGKHLDAAYDIASRLFDDDEDLMHKAVGWLLREAGKTDMKRLERFLRAEGPKIPRTSVRYAIERFPKDGRKRLLEATR